MLPMRTVFQVIARSYPIFLIGISILFGLQAAYSQESLSLKQCFDLAAARSERLEITARQIEIAEAQYRQALALIYPKINLNLDQTVRDNPDFGRLKRSGSSLEDPSGPTAGRTGSIGRTQFEADITVSQPLFNGFRDLLAAESSEQSRFALKEDLQRQHDLLYMDVAELYYQILLYQADLGVLARSGQVLVERQKELQGFMDLGKSRESEVLAAKSDIADLESTVQNTKGLLLATKELLSSLIGIPSEQIALKNAPKQTPLLAEDEYLKLSEKRADIKAAEFRVSGQQKLVTAAERERWGELSLQGTAYPYEDPDRTREWNLLLRMQVPIFEGGAISARVDEEQSQLRIHELQLKEAKRIAEQEVRVAYTNVQSSQREAASLRLLLDTARKSYESQRKDYQFGVVTNLEVLQSIRQMQEAERRKTLADIQVSLRQERLKVASGAVE